MIENNHEFLEFVKERAEENVRLIAAILDEAAQRLDRKNRPGRYGLFELTLLRHLLTEWSDKFPDGCHADQENLLKAKKSVEAFTAFFVNLGLPETDEDLDLALLLKREG